jgi:hypothetical protein
MSNAADKESAPKRDDEAPDCTITVDERLVRTFGDADGIQHCG